MAYTPNQRDQSEFNMAVSYLNRLNALFYLCDESTINQDLYSWFQSLVTLFKELSTEMKDDEINEYQAKLKGLFEGVNRCVNESKRTGVNKIPQDLYWKLHEFELFLRRILKDAGLQQKMREDLSIGIR